MAKAQPRDILTQDGIRGIHSYFKNALIAYILLIIILAVFFLFYLGGATNGLLLFVVIAAILAVAACVLGIFSFLGFWYGLRDIRRSQLPSAAVYTDISRWLKYLISIMIIVSILLFVFVAISAALSVESAFMYTGASSASPYSTLTTIFEIIVFVIGVVFTYKIVALYKTLGKDLSQDSLVTAGTLLLAALGVDIVLFVLSLAVGLTMPTSVATVGMPAAAPSIGVFIILIVALIVVILEIASLYLGYKGTKAAMQ